MPSSQPPRVQTPGPKVLDDSIGDDDDDKFLHFFAFDIQQYNFSPIGYDPKVSLLLARIAISIADVMKGLWMWGGGGFKKFVVDFSV